MDANESPKTNNNDPVDMDDDSSEEARQDYDRALEYENQTYEHYSDDHTSTNW